MKRLAALLILFALAVTPLQAQFSGSGPGFRIGGGLVGQGDGRTLPANTVAPAISGVIYVGYALSATDGTWTGTPTPTFTYQWNSNGTPIGGATANSYTTVNGDAGNTITVTVTATNNAGIASAASSGVGPIGTVSSQASAFLARTSSLDATHTNAYIALINNLVTDSIWSKLDVLRVYATQNTTTALLNLVSSSFAGTVHGSPTFTADRGYTGTDTSTTIYIDSGFNPSTAGGQYSRNSAHLSAWIVNNTGATQPAFGHTSSGSTSVAYSWPQFTSDGKAYNRINSAGSGSDGATPAAYTGLFTGSRTGASAVDSYRNATVLRNGTEASTALVNSNFYELGINNNGTADGAGNQYAMVSVGSSLSSTDVTNFYNRLRTYMTAVGVP